MGLVIAIAYKLLYRLGFKNKPIILYFIWS